MVLIRDCPPLDELPRLFGARVVRVRDLESLGFNRRTIAYRCRPEGPWTRMAPGIVKIDNGPLTRADRRQAAILQGGQQVRITGLDGLNLHGFCSIPAPSGPVHVLIPHERRCVGGQLAVVERTDRLPDPTPGCWPLAPAPRAVLDFARRSGDRPLVRAVVAEAVQRKRCTVAELAAELRAGNQRGSALPRSVLGEIGAGVRSAAEAVALEIIRSGTFPEPLRNVDLLDDTGEFVARPDAWFDDVGLAWEIDSVEYHLSPEDYARTVARRSAMMARGALVMQTLPSTLTRDRAGVAQQLLVCLEQAGRLPRPRLYPRLPNEGHPRAT